MAAGYMPSIKFSVRWLVYNTATIVGSIVTPLVLFGSRIQAALHEKGVEDHTTLGREKEFAQRPLFANDHPELGNYYAISNVRDNGFKIDPAAGPDFLVLVSGKGKKSRLVLQFPHAEQTRIFKELITRGSNGSGNEIVSSHGSGSSGSLPDPNRSKRTAYQSGDELAEEV
ncbi:hypothetical protein HDU86_004001 [Geranomyces michiganensis]|nr:hypothetical protein HDU86_004001 [Geranomyces michiganensis]